MGFDTASIGGVIVSFGCVGMVTFVLNGADCAVLVAIGNSTFLAVIGVVCWDTHPESKTAKMTREKIGSLSMVL